MAKGQDETYREQEPIAEAPQHPVIYYRAQGKSPRGGNQYPVPSSMATIPSREDQEEDMFDEILVPYRRLGLTDPDDIRDMALIQGTPALAEAELALQEMAAPSTALLLLPLDPPGKNVAGFLRRIAQRYSRTLLGLYPGSIQYPSMIEMLRLSIPDVQNKVHPFELKRASLAEALEMGRVRPGHALEVYAPGPIMDQIVSERDGGGLPLDPTVIRIVAAQVPTDDPGRIRNAMSQPTDAPAKALLDPHIFSSQDGLDRVRRALGEALQVEFLADISPRHDREDGATRILQIVEANRGLLSQRDVDTEGMRFLGKGNNGLAWELRDKRVLKVTTDDAEAAVAVHLKGKHLKHVFQVHDVWAFPGTYEGHHVYGLITEPGLVPLSEQEKYDFAQLIVLLTMDPTDEYSEIDPGKRDRLESGDLRPLLQGMMADPNVRPDHKRQVLTLAKKFDLPGIAADAKRLGVAFDIADHPGNVMKRPDGTFVVIDIGTGGDQEAAKPPFLEDRTPLAEDVLREEGYWAAPALAAEIVQANAERLQRRGIVADVDGMLGAGSKGTAFAVPGGKVLKVTADASEAVVSLLIKNHPREHLVHIFDVFRFPQLTPADYGQRSATQLARQGVFGILEERLTEPSAQESEMISWLNYNRSNDAINVLEWPTLLAGKIDPRTGRELSLTRAGIDPNAFWSTAQKLGVDKIIEDLRAIGVTYYNDLTSENVMKRGSTLVLIDPGYSQSKTATVPTLERRLAEVGVLAAPQNSAPRGGPLGRGGNQSSSWSSGRMALRAPADHVPVDDNEEGQIPLDTEYGVKLPEPEGYETHDPRQ